MEVLLSWCLRTSWQVALLVLGILVVQRLFARWLTPRWRYGLWGLVVVRLLLPVQPAVPGAAVDWELTSYRPSIERSDEVEVDLRTSERAIEPAPTMPAADAAPAAALRSRPAASLLGETARSEKTVSEASPPVSRRVPWKGLAVGAWLAIALLLLLRDLRRERGFRRRLARAPRVLDPEVLDLVEECRRAAGFGSPVALIRTDLVASPAATGLFRPRVLLPDSVLRDFSPAELRHVLLHELAHLKRGDVALNALLVALKRLYWFHPLVHLAFARLRAAQESARDWEALALARDSGPVPYARTLLRLVEETPRSVHSSTRAPSVGFLHGSPDMKWRILMITRFRPTTKRSAFLGVALVATLSWTAFTTAATPPLPAALVGAPEDASKPPERVRVERQSAPEEWRADLRDELQQYVDVAFHGASLGTTIDWLRERTGINFVAERRFLLDYEGERFWLQGKLRVEQVLDLLARSIDNVDWCLARHAVYVGERGDLPQALDLRFYNVGDLIRTPRNEEEEEEFSSDVDEVIALTQELTYEENTWESDGVAIDYWRGLVVIMQTDEMHVRAEAALNRMLNRGAQPEVEEPDWRAELAEELQRKLSIHFDETDAVDMARLLGRERGVPIVFPNRYREEFEVALVLEDVTLGTALEWLADACELSVSLQDGAVVFDDFPPVEARFYEAGDLLRSRPGYDDWETADGLTDMIRNHVAPDTWDEDPRCRLFYWRDMLVCVQSRPVLDAVQNLLDAARRASSD